MSVLPPDLYRRIEEGLGVRVVAQRAVGGGMVNHAARVDTDHGSLFVKWKPSTPPRFFEMEADGLRLLRAAAALRVPDVVAFADMPEADPGYLVLEWIDESRPGSADRFRAKFADGLAALHRTASPAGLFGLETDNFLGSQPQANTWGPNWPAFYRDLRVAVQLQKAKDAGLLPPLREMALRSLMERFDEILDDLDARPVLIHGDLWSGNYLTAGDEPVLIDPAVYYADREVELAFIELFGGFPPNFIAAYDRAYPLQPGYAYRRPLHQLYPLLVHLNHFGETYGPAVDDVCRWYDI